MQNFANIFTSNNHGNIVGQHYGDIHYNKSYANCNDHGKKEKEEKRKELESKIAACCEAIYITDPVVDRETIKSTRGERVPGTCEWIKSNAKYRKWLNPSTNPSLWLFGGPGRGKTVISMFLIEDLEKYCEKDNKLLTFFFCDHRDQNRSSAVAVLRGVIWQIIKARPALYSHIAHCDKDSKQSKHVLSSREALWMIFENILKDSRLGVMFCIIDGLDECDQDSVIWLSRVLGQTLPMRQAMYSNTAKFFIASRPEMNSHLQSMLKIDLSAIQASDVRNDVKMFISERMKVLEMIPGFTSKASQIVKDSLSSRSEGSFLWVGCVISELQLKLTCTEVLQALDEFPTDLGALYDRILCQINENQRHDCVRIIQWIIHARDSLTLLELAEVLTLADNSGISREQAVRDRIVWCRSLVTVQESQLDPGMSVVRLIHVSFQQHVTSIFTSTTAPSIQVFGFDPEILHLQMARFCLDYFKHHLPEGELWDCGDHLANRRSPLMKYAIMNWGQHARLSRGHANELLESHRTEIEGDLVRKSWAFSWRKARKPDISFEQALGGQIPPFYILSTLLGIANWVSRDLSTLDYAARKTLLDKGNRTGNTALQYAVEQGHQDVVELLLKLGATLDDLSVFIAVEEGHHQCLEFLLNRHGNANVMNSNDNGTALHEAAGQGLVNIMNLLLKWGGNPNNAVLALPKSLRAQFPTSSPLTTSTYLPIEVAVFNGSLETLEILFPITKKTPQLIVDLTEDAIKLSREDVFRYLCRMGKEALLPCTRRLLDEILKSHSEALMTGFIEELDFDVNTRFPDLEMFSRERSISVVHYASRVGDSGIMRVLLEKGAVLEEGMATGAAFLCAASHGDMRTFDIILGRGADINYPLSEAGETVLHVAAHLPNRYPAEVLVAKNANVNCTTRDGETPLMVAAAAGDQATVELLLANGANTQAKDVLGRTATKYAADAGHKAIVALLVASIQHS